jgi:hypothetical protein
VRCFALLELFGMISSISDLYAGRECSILHIFIEYSHIMRLAPWMTSWLLPLPCFLIETWLHGERLGYGKRIKRNKKRMLCFLLFFSASPSVGDGLALH